MQAIKPNKTIYFLAILSLLPLLFSLSLALYFYFDWGQITDVFLPWARLNSYIYSHSYAALLLVMFAGIQMGQALNPPYKNWTLLFHFGLLILTWLSFKSFADYQGMLLLTICWAASCLFDMHSLKQNNSEYGIIKLKINLKLTIIVMLVLLITING